MHASAVTDAKVQMSLAPGVSLTQILKQIVKKQEHINQLKGQEDKSFF